MRAPRAPVADPKEKEQVLVIIQATQYQRGLMEALMQGADFRHEARGRGGTLYSARMTRMALAQLCALKPPECKLYSIQPV